jgi:membrane protein
MPLIVNYDLGHMPKLANSCSVSPIEKGYPRFGQSRQETQAAVATTTLRLSGISPKEILKRTWSEIRADDVFGRAAQLAYYFFLALFPFLICVIAALSIFGAADRGRGILFALFARFLPAPAFDLIAETFGQIVASSGPLKMSVGVLASVWSASLGMSAMMDTLNAAYRVKETRSIFKQYLIAIALTLGIGLLIVLSTLMVVVGDSVIAALALPHAVSTTWHIVEWPLAVALLLFGFALTYYFAPDLKTRKWRWITPGALAGLVLLLLVSAGMRVYLHFYGSYSATYGSLAGVIVLLLCFYLGGVAVLSGGVLNGVIEDAAHNRSGNS